MTNKLWLVLSLFMVEAATADPDTSVGSVWGTGQGPTVSLYADPVAHSVGDLITIVVNLQNQVTKDQNTNTSKATAVSSVINSLLYPANGSSNGYQFLMNNGQPPTTAWTSSQSFTGGGTVANNETASTTIQARVVAVGPDGVLKIEAIRLSKAGDEDTSMTLVGLVRPEDLNDTNTISSSQVADLQIIQKGKGTLTNNQRKGWLTKFYELIEPF